jgi:hypothetical protein
MFGVIFALAGWWGWTLATGRGDGYLHVNVLSEGDTVVVKTPAGERLVIGGGSPLATTTAAVDALIQPWDREVAVVAATRVDKSHLFTLAEAVKRYQPQKAVALPQLNSNPDGLLWNMVITDTRVSLVNPLQIQSFSTSDGVNLSVIKVDEVEGAVLYRLALGEVSVMLAGGLRRPTTLPGVPASALLISSRATPELAEALMQTYRPAATLVYNDATTQSAGDRIHDQLSRLTSGSVVSIHERGQVTLVTDGQRLWLEEAEP